MPGIIEDVKKYYQNWKKGQQGVKPTAEQEKAAAEGIKATKKTMDEQKTKNPLKAVSGALSGVPSYEHGGTVRKTGLAIVHKGERVTPVKRSVERRSLREASRGRRG
jgi:hypothetical protein